MLGHVGLRWVTACVLGAPEDAAWAIEEASRHGVALAVARTINDMGEFENPTLRESFLFAHANQNAAVLYLHTKGASRPDCQQKRQWRRVMMKQVVAKWRWNLELAQVADIVGVSWMTSRALPHFAGNFWLARCDWLIRLENPADYRNRYRPDDCRFAGQPWRRMHAECWVGSAQWHHIESLLGWNLHMWHHHEAFRHSIDVEGFSYDA